jgi:hypothetical protein
MKTGITILALLLAACGGGDPDPDVSGVQPALICNGPACEGVGPVHPNTPSLVCEGYQRDGSAAYVPCTAFGPFRPEGS